MRFRIQREAIEAFCRRWRVRQFSLFGSVLRSDFRPASDIDALVVFEDGCSRTLLDLIEMRNELGKITGRDVDIATRVGVEKSRNSVRRTEILNSARSLWPVDDSGGGGEVEKTAARDDAYLLDILDSAELTLEYTAQMTLEQFLGDVRAQDAVLWRLWLMGEAARRMSETSRKRFEAVAWTTLASIPTLLIHQDMEVVWNTVRLELTSIVEILKKGHRA